jgi:hypothetical protein
MRAKLAMIALSSFAVSAVCLGGAFALGGGQLGNAAFNFSDFGGGFGQPRCDASGSSAPTADTVRLSWVGDSDKVAIAVPAVTHYQAGVGDLLVVKGDPALISHIRVHNGTVDLDCRSGFGRSDRLDITLPGKRTFQKFEMLGSGDMQLNGLSQPDAKVEVAGSGTVETEGHVNRLNLEIDGSGTVQSKGQSDNLLVDVNGSGKVQSAELVAKYVRVDISGSGKVDVAPQNSLNVDISGSGTIYLHSEPKNLETDISGSGSIVHSNGDVQDRHEKHAELEKIYRHGRHIDSADRAEINAIVQEALRDGHGPDPDEIQAATAKLNTRIRAEVAKELENADVGDRDNDSGR